MERNGVAAFRVDLVTVHALEEYRLSVHADPPALHLDFAESNPEQQRLKDLAGRRAERHLEVVEIGRLGAPEMRRGDGQDGVRAGRLRDLTPSCIGEREGHIACARRLGRDAALPAAADIRLVFRRA